MGLSEEMQFTVLTTLPDVGRVMRAARVMGREMDVIEFLMNPNDKVVGLEERVELLKIAPGLIATAWTKGTIRSKWLEPVLREVFGRERPENEQILRDIFAGDPNETEGWYYGGYYYDTVAQTLLSSLSKAYVPLALDLLIKQLAGAGIMAWGDAEIESICTNPQLNSSQIDKLIDAALKRNGTGARRQLSFLALEPTKNKLSKIQWMTLAKIGAFVEWSEFEKLPPEVMIETVKGIDKMGDMNWVIKNTPVKGELAEVYQAMLKRVQEKNFQLSEPYLTALLERLMESPKVKSWLQDMNLGMVYLGNTAKKGNAEQMQKILNAVGEIY